ncbi:GNAT family N-acetyltransferase [Peterkaempfera bronchialis]|uniref:N-acetyltransferase n=1 Tax=Peterkaempfera bronchialis TaxID=2126346 RepID=A0A345T0E1_9ACTN|nr:GNAT family protein [Peterkaempfera bronchialis]AXI79446.1 N-acetyltransferase [Peterkaempfera bronchialis]
MADRPEPDFLTKPTLMGEKVVLRPVAAGDVAALLPMMTDPEVRRLTGSHAEVSESRAVQWYASRPHQDDRLDLAVVDRESGACVGEAVLNEWSPEDESCNFRILVGPPGQNRGLGTEAVRLTVGYGFEKLGLHRISLEVYSFNPRARRAYEKVGFVAEGVLRDALRWDGEWVDATVMSILAPEWERHHGRPRTP